MSGELEDAKKKQVLKLWDEGERSVQEIHSRTQVPKPKIRQVLEEAGRL